MVKTNDSIPCVIMSTCDAYVHVPELSDDGWHIEHIQYMCRNSVITAGTSSTYSTCVHIMQSMA